MLYLKCPTCRTTLSDVVIQYDMIFEQICADEDAGKISKEVAEEQKRDLVNMMELSRYCCKMRLMTYCKNINLIK